MASMLSLEVEGRGCLVTSELTIIIVTPYQFKMLDDCGNTI